MRDFRDFRTHKQVRQWRQKRYVRAEIEVKASLDEGLGDWRDEPENCYHYHDGWEGLAEFIDDHFGCSRRLRNNCDCCQGSFLFGGEFWSELATTVALDMHPPESLLDYFRAFASELGGVELARNTPETYRSIELDTLTAADRRVIAWQEGWRFENPELVLEAIVSQPKEAAAFAHLRKRVISPLDTIPYSEWPGGMDRQFDAERVAHLAMMLFPLWKVPLSQWRGGSAIDLLQHLLAPKSEMPALFSEAMSPHYEFRMPCAIDPLIWLVAESQGASIRSIARYYGVNLSGKQIALAMASLDAGEACGDLAFLLMCQELRLMGGSEVELRRIADFFYAKDVVVIAQPAYVAFWRSAVVWLVQWRDHLTDEQAGSVLLWARHRYLEGGKFSFSRRTVSSALEHAQEYECEIESRVEAARKAKASLRWEAHAWNLAWIDASGVAWSVNELTDQMALAVEGAVQSHCVGSYGMACAEGRSAILQLLRGRERAVTIEVRPAEMRIAQALGRFNTIPSVEARAAIYYWANNFGINL
jgi:hypothetical protein